MEYFRDMGGFQAFSFIGALGDAMKHHENFG